MNKQKSKIQKQKTRKFDAPLFAILHISYSHIILLDDRKSFSTRTHLGLVKVVNKVLNNGSSVGGLNVLAVVGDHSARRGTDNNSALLTLFPKTSQSC
jgi:hypothetical protein